MKTVIDWISVIGLFLTLFAIWLSWWLAKKDLEKRITLAQRQTIERLTSIWLESDIVETGRCLREARELCRLLNWPIALDRCEQAMHRVPRFKSLPGLHADELPRLDELVDKLRLLIRQIVEIMEQTPDRTGSAKTKLTNPKLKDLDDMVALLATLEGKMRAAALR